jgi:lysophospholipase L1-like esterase
MTRLPAILLAAAFMNAPAHAQARVRVACVGDSITYGDQIVDRGRDSYPAVLQRLSRDRYLTGNFCVNGATALKIPFRSWTGTRAFRDALAFNPAAVVVMLGINDSAYPELHDRYPADLGEIVTRFQALPSKPRLFLCTLTPIAPPEHQVQVNQLIRDTLNPAIRAVAARTGAQLIDISAAYPNRLDLLPDGLHPNPAGAEIIARTVLAALDAAFAPAAAPAISPAPGPVDLSIRHEVLAARFRAEQWLAAQTVPDAFPDPSDSWAGRDLHEPADVADLLPLLAGDLPPELPDPYFQLARLAHALDRIGHETVFLADDRPVAWREALLRQLVRRQRIDAAGGGYWAGPSTEPAAAATAGALQAIAAALRE